MSRALYLKFPVLLAAVMSFACAAKADVSSVPVGYLAVKIAAGTPAAPVSTSFALPLTDEPQNVGVSEGRVSALASNRITVKGAGWNPGKLGTKKAPYAVRFKTGAQAGLTLVITDNTADTLTVDTSMDLTKSGLKKGASGNLVQLIPIDTLDSLFGDDTLIGAKKQRNADVVFLGANRRNGYYYNTSLDRWVSTDGTTKDCGRVRVSPDAVVTIARVGEATTLYFDGRVPETKYRVDVANSGETYTHTGFPTDTTLGELALQKKIPGWVAAKKPGKADQIAVASGKGWVSYFYTGSKWVRTDGSTKARAGVVIKAGVPIRITRVGKAKGATTLVLARPYEI